MGMKSKERLQTVFKNLKPDKIPIWMMFPFKTEPYAADVYNSKSYDDVSSYIKNNTDFIERSATNVDFLNTPDISKKYSIDFIFNHPGIRKESRFYQKKSKCL